MEKSQYANYLIQMSKALKHFYETPVIFVTKKDYSDNIFNTMCKILTSIENENKEEMIDIIAEFHLQWLHAVNEVENFKKLISDLPREDMYQAVSFTIDAMTYRLKYYKVFMEKHRSILSNDDQSNLLSDIEIVEDMHKDVTHHLLDKLKCFRNYVGSDEFQLKVIDAVDELLQWLDKIYDELTLNVCKYVDVSVPHLSTDLTKTLQHIVDEIQHSQSESAITFLKQLKSRGKELTSMIRGIGAHDLEISKVLEKISILDDRIQRLEHEQFSAALMALQNKKDFLVKRLLSLENLKSNLKNFQNLTNTKIMDDVAEEELCVCEDFYQLRVFNHMLPPEERERLITELCFLWDSAIFGERNQKSIISILSAADMKEEFTDELGTFYIDEYSRKIYKILDVLYQPNEMNKLVPVSDDTEHVYFYDECGRYFVDNKTRQRVYKAHATASEYMMDSTGVLLKIKEIRDGVTYHYDNCGRYYINEEGKQIYREVDSVSEYEQDGLGNLVRVRSQLDIFVPCPDDANVTEDFKYLKQTVGAALRKSIADVILHQPVDPIKFLSLRLIKYRENMELKDKRAIEKEELKVQREIIIAEQKAADERAAMEAASLFKGGSEASYDSNLLKYTSLQEEDDSYKT